MMATASSSATAAAAGALRSRRIRRPVPIVSVAGALVCALLAAALLRIGGGGGGARHLLGWCLAQFLPATLPLPPLLTGGVGGGPRELQRAAWEHWEKEEEDEARSRRPDRGGGDAEEGGDLEIPTVNVQEHSGGGPEELLKYLESTHGRDWRKRPLLLKGLWSPEELRGGDGGSRRRLSLEGLLNDTTVIPYFKDSRKVGALTPDGEAPVRDVVSRIFNDGAPHKIGTQLIVQSDPELIREVAPTDIVTALFGDYFKPDAVLGSGPVRLLPPLTTVPVFVAWKRPPSQQQQHQAMPPEKSGADTFAGGGGSSSSKCPYTALHCEPIGNVAVQLSGRKEWILVQPEHSRKVRPSVAPDGRAFFASWLPSLAWTATAKDVGDGGVSPPPPPFYRASTEAGDAVWVPTWTWHRVDYVESDEVAIGASLFHFRPVDFVANNPLFAALVVPALFRELVGWNTQ